MVNSTPQGKIQREKEETRTNLETRLSVSLAKKKPPPLSSQFAVIEVVGDTKRKKDTQKEPTFMYICACVSF